MNGTKNKSGSRGGEARRSRRNFKALEACAARYEGMRPAADGIKLAVEQIGAGRVEAALSGRRFRAEIADVAGQAPELRDYCVILFAAGARRVRNEAFGERSSVGNAEDRYYDALRALAQRRSVEERPRLHEVENACVAIGEQLAAEILGEDLRWAAMIVEGELGAAQRERRGGGEPGEAEHWSVLARSTRHQRQAARAFLAMSREERGRMRGERRAGARSRGQARERGGATVMGEALAAAGLGL